MKMAKFGTPINTNVAIRTRYESALMLLVLEMRKATESELKHVFGNKPAELGFNFDEKPKQVSTKAKLALAALLLKFQLLFKGSSRRLAMQLVANTEKYATTVVRSSLYEMTGEMRHTGRISDKGIMRQEAIVAENVSLLKSIPEQYFTQITSAVMSAISTGVTTDLESAIQKHGDVSERRARAIAADQTHKAIQSISMQKMLDQGFKKFQWVYTYRSKESRPSHVRMNGKIYRFDDPPVVNADRPSEPPRRGLPGSEINCKCVARPVMEME